MAKRIKKNTVNTTAKFGIVIPVANEEGNIDALYQALKKELNILSVVYRIYFVSDAASKDRTRMILTNIIKNEKVATLIYEPKNRNVVDAYLRGFRQAIEDGCDYVIEMDAGFSHQPIEIRKFIQGLNDGYDCIFGIRPLLSSKYRINFLRKMYSIVGTKSSNLLLGLKMRDITSGFEGFKCTILKEVIKNPFISTGHAWHIEIKNRCRNYSYKEVPIHYTAPSNSITNTTLDNSIRVLIKLTLDRFKKA